MDFLNGKIKTLYFKYLSAAFGSALITSIYSIVDMAMVGQYHGPEGSAALAGSGTGVEYHLQPGASDGNRRLCSFQHDQRKGRRRHPEVESVFYRFGDRFCYTGRNRLAADHPI